MKHSTRTYLVTLFLGLFLMVGALLATPQEVASQFFNPNVAPLITSVSSSLNNEQNRLTITASGVSAATQVECNCEPPPYGEPICPSFIFSKPYAQKSQGDVFIYEPGKNTPVITKSITYSKRSDGVTGNCDYGDTSGLPGSFSGTANSINISSLKADVRYEVEVRACHESGTSCDIATDFFTKTEGPGGGDDSGGDDGSDDSGGTDDSGTTQNGTTDNGSTGDGDFRLTVHARPVNKLEINSSPGGIQGCENENPKGSDSCSALFGASDTVNLNVTYDDGYVFDRITGDSGCKVSGDQPFVTMNNNNRECTVWAVEGDEDPPEEVPTIDLEGRETGIGGFSDGPVYVADTGEDIKNLEIQWSFGGGEADSCTTISSDGKPSGWLETDPLVSNNPQTYQNFANRSYFATCSNESGTGPTEELEVRVTGDVIVEVIDPSGQLAGDVAQWTLSGPEDDEVQNSYSSGETYTDKTFGPYTLSPSLVEIDPDTGFELDRVEDSTQTLNHSANPTTFTIYLKETAFTGTIDADPNPCLLAVGETECDSMIAWTKADFQTAKVFQDGTLFACGGADSNDKVARDITQSGNVFELFAATPGSCSDSSVISGVVASVFVTAIPDGWPRLQILPDTPDRIAPGEQTSFTAWYDSGTDGNPDFEDEVTVDANTTWGFESLGGEVTNDGGGFFTGVTEGDVRITASYFDGTVTVGALPRVLTIDDLANNPECSDGIDNDEDGFTDFSGGDPQCRDEEDDKELGEAEIIEF